MTTTVLRDPTALIRRGLADAGSAAVLARLVTAWDEFLDVAAEVDLQRPTRLPGWRAQEVCVHLGVWDDYRALDTLLTSARSGGHGPAPDVDASNAAVVAAHRDAGRDQVLAALRRHRDDIARCADDDPGLDVPGLDGPGLDGPDVDGPPLEDLATASVAGRLPLLTVLMGEAYELAVHALDLHSAGAPAPPTSLLQAGIGALADVTGALAASMAITGSAVLSTPDGGWRFDADDHGWTTTALPPGARPPGAGVSGAPEVLLDASAGRNNPIVQLARRRLKVHDLPGLLRLTPIVEVAPGIPGGPILRLAARTLHRGRPW